MSFYKLDKALLNGQYNFKPKLGSRNHLVKYSIWVTKVLEEEEEEEEEDGKLNGWIEQFLTKRK